MKIHPEIARFALEYRQVLFCFDADHLKNRNVRQAEIRAFMLFYAAGADVYQLTTWSLEEGKGVDDYLARKAGNDPEKQKQVFAELCNDREKVLPFTLSRRSTGAIRSSAGRNCILYARRPRQVQGAWRTGSQATQHRHRRSRTFPRPSARREAISERG